jgi:hypothetical protein
LGRGYADFRELRTPEVPRIRLLGRWGNKDEKGRRSPAGFGVRTIGYILIIVLWGKEDREMYWYNPTTRTSERAAAPSTDEEAVDMLTGDPDSAEFVKEYGKLRDSGLPIEAALVLVGHEFRLRQSGHRLALR